MRIIFSLHGKKNGVEKTGDVRMRVNKHDYIKWALYYKLDDVLKEEITRRLHKSGIEVINLGYARPIGSHARPDYAKFGRNGQTRFVATPPVRKKHPSVFDRLAKGESFNTPSLPKRELRKIEEAKALIPVPKVKKPRAKKVAE